MGKAAAKEAFRRSLGLGKLLRPKVVEQMSSSLRVENLIFVLNSALFSWSEDVQP